MGIRRLFNDDTLYVFDETGVTLPTDASPIPWQQIESCSIVKVRRARFLAFQTAGGERTIGFGGVTPSIERAIDFITAHAPSVVLKES